MSAPSSRGFSLVELLVSVVLLGVITAGVASVALSAVRTADRSRERARQESVLREVAAIVEREVGDVSPARDIGGFSAESVTYRAGRGSGFTCGVEAGAVVVRDADFRAWRLPDAARDSLLVLLPGDSLGSPAWVISPLLAAPARGHCRDGAPGLRLTIDAAFLAPAATTDLPIRVFEWMRLRLYPSAGSWWVGARSLRPGDVIQPIAGPFASRGLSLGWVDGAATSSAPASARFLEVRLVAAAPLAASPGRGSAIDTLLATIALRNGGTP